MAINIICSGDFHGEIPAKMAEIVEKDEIDAALLTGDYMPFFEADYWKTDELMKFLGKLQIPIYMVHGNTDFLALESLSIWERKHKNLHFIDWKRIILGNHWLVGVGIGEDWLYLGEKDIRVVERLVQIDPKRTILLSHYPPFGVVDFTLSDTHAGDGYLRRLIERYQPPLVICGHIHEAKGIDKIGDTLVVNPYNDPIIIDLERMEIDG